MTQIANREHEIRQRLEAKMKVSELLFEDFSEQHSGHYHHPEPKHGASHVNLLVVSEDFSDLNRVQRSRLVYSALNELLQSRGLHALTLKLLTPNEWMEAKKENSK